MRLKLYRPLALFDIESTGINRQTDRIIDLAVLKLHPDGSSSEHSWRLNPQMPIPPGATAIHGIHDEDVADAPTFTDKAAEIEACFDGCDFGGFNVLGFDLPLLQEEFRRVDRVFDYSRARVIDAQRIFHQKEPRNLSAAVRFYCHRDHEDAHGAMPDVVATRDVLAAQLEHYEDLPADVDELSEWCDPREPHWVDRSGRLVWNDDGRCAVNFSKNKGRTLEDLALKDRGFLEWILRKDFPADVRDIVRDALEGRFPEPPEA